MLKIQIFDPKKYKYLILKIQMLRRLVKLDPFLSSAALLPVRTRVSSFSLLSTHILYLYFLFVFVFLICIL